MHPSLQALISIVMLVTACGGEAKKADTAAAGGQQGPDAGTGGGGGQAAPPSASEFGSETLEGLVSAFIAGYNRRDFGFLTTLCPPEELRKAAVACGQENSFEKAIEEFLGDVRQSMADNEYSNIVLVSLDLKTGKEQTYPAGTPIEDDCKAGLDVTLKEVHATIDAVKGGTPVSDTIGVAVILIEGRWYIVTFD